MAAGGLSWASPDPLALETFHFLLDIQGRRFGIFPPGWPSVLALGVLLGVSWAVNPVLHGATVLLGAWVGHRVGGALAGSLAAPILALSPGLLLLAGSRMSHTWTALVVLAGVAWSLQAGRKAGCLVGLCLGVLVLTRPLDAMVLGLVVLPGLLSQGVRVTLWSGLGPLLGLAVLAGVNLAVTGDPLLLPQSAYFSEGLPPIQSGAFRYAAGCNGLGFGDAVGCFPTYGDLGHTPDKALRSVGRNLAAAGRLWMGHGVLGLFAIAAWRQPNARPLLKRAASLWALLVAVYALYWVPGLAYGARFHHSAAPVVIIACAVGVAGLLAAHPRIPWITGLVVLIPGVARLSAALPELTGYWGVDGRFAELERRWEGPDALILVAYGARGGRVMQAPQTLGAPLTAMPHLWRGAWLGRDDGKLAYVEFQPALVDAARGAWPGRPSWLYVMQADRLQDQLIPLDRLAREVQVSELALPVDPFTLSAFPVPPIPISGPLP
jgi:hypothetical protein